MNEKELLLAFLSKTLNMDTSGVASLIYNEDGSELKSDALSVLETKAKDNVSKFKGKFDEGHKAGTREALSRLEKEFKEKTGFESDAEGVQLFMDYADSNVADAVTRLKPNEMTEDDVRSHRLFLDMEGKLSKAEKERLQAIEDAVSGVKSEFQKKEMFGEIKKRATKQLMEMKPVLSEDETKRGNQLGLLYGELSGYEFQERSDGEVVLLKEGKPIDDDLGHHMTLSKFVGSAANKYYDFMQSDNRQAPPPKTGQQATFKLVKPTSQGEFLKQYDEIQKDTKMSAEDKKAAGIQLKALYKGEAVTQ